MSDDSPTFTGFVRDLTSRVQAQQEREALLQRELSALRDAESANRAKDDFLATLSHELRTPLNAILGWTRMLLDGTMDARSSRKALQVIDRNAHLQAQLVADILDVSRIITGGLRLDLQPVDLGSVIGATLDAVRPAADAKQVQLRSRLETVARLTEGDPQRLQQIVWNLLSNAVKFTPTGGTITIELDDVGEAASGFGFRTREPASSRHSCRMSSNDFGRRTVASAGSMGGLGWDWRSSDTSWSYTEVRFTPTVRESERDRSLLFIYPEWIPSGPGYLPHRPSEAARRTISVHGYNAAEVVSHARRR